MWVKLDDDFADHPKVVGLSDKAFRAYVSGLCYCARQLTDGHIPSRMVKALAPGRSGTELEQAGLWIQNGSGVVVHDYLEFQPATSHVTAATWPGSRTARPSSTTTSRPRSGI